MKKGASKRISRTFQLRGYFGSGRMCALIVKTAKSFTSSVTLSRYGKRAGTKSIMELMMFDAERLEEDISSRAVTVSAEGPDALAAVEAVVALFPEDGGAERCVVSGCNLPAVLTGSGGNRFSYRCAVYEKHHKWDVSV